MTTLNIQAYELFKTRFGEKEASFIIDYLNSLQKEGISLFEAKATFLTDEKAKNTFATKEDLARLETNLTVRIVTVVLGQTAILFALFKFFI